MLKNIRYKIGVCFMKKGAEQLENGEYKKAFRNIKRGVRVVPLSKELSDFGECLRNLAEEQRQSLETGS